jgi:hypothetical protein
VQISRAEQQSQKIFKLDLGDFPFCRLSLTVGQASVRFLLKELPNLKSNYLP